MTRDVRTGRVYDPPPPDGGRRVLVDRLWPRGMRKADAPIDEWCKEVAPSNELRRWYGHRAEEFEEFRSRYETELAEPERGAALDHLRGLAAAGPLTLLTATRAVDISQAAVLADLVAGGGGNRGRQPGGSTAERGSEHGASDNPARDAVADPGSARSVDDQGTEEQTPRTGNDTVERGPALDRLRALCLAFPGASERLSHGEPSWFVRKQFVTFADHHHDDRLGFWAAAPDGAQDRWVHQNPARFFVPPYVGGRGWVGVYLDVPQDWDDVAEIVEAAYLSVAPAKLIREWEAGARQHPADR